MPDASLITIEHEGRSLTLAADEWLRRARAKCFRFTDEECVYILELFEGRRWTQGEIANRYGVCRRTIVRACARARNLQSEETVMP